MGYLRRGLLILLVLLPLATLVHKNERWRWDVQRSAMAAPDELSYLLMADHFGRGGGLSLREAIGRDTFYPPGYPLLLAGWSKSMGGEVTAFKAHALNAVLLCVDTALAYLLVRRLLRQMGKAGHRRFHYGEETQAWLAVLAAGVFAANWHVLETSLFIMSEPAFMLAVFGWLALGMRWRSWHRNAWQAGVMGLLATAAWSIRGAGIVCVAATMLYPILIEVRHVFVRRTGEGRAEGKAVALDRARLLGTLAIVLLFPIAYQGVLKKMSPEKALASGAQTANSYTDQLLTGLTDGHRLSFRVAGDYPRLAMNLRNLVFDHFADYASSFVPWPRENPDWHFRVFIGKVVAWLGLVGWLWHLLGAGGGGRGRFLGLFVLLYMGLYLVWPFSFARFWSPVLPVMLAFGADAVIRFSTAARFPAPQAAGVMLGLLLVLSVEEAWLQMGNYARRLNYVSDSLARAAEAIVKSARGSPAEGGAPRGAVAAAMNGDDHFVLAWYLSRTPGGAGIRVYSPEAHVAAKGGEGENPGELLVRLVREAPGGTEGSAGGGGRRVYLFSYFGHGDAAWWLGRLVRETPDLVEEGSVRKIFQQEIIAGVWEIRRREGTGGMP